MKTLSNGLLVNYIANYPNSGRYSKHFVVADKYDATSLIAKWNREGKRGGYTYFIESVERASKETLSQIVESEMLDANGIKYHIVSNDMDDEDLIDKDEY